MQVNVLMQADAIDRAVWDDAPEQLVPVMQALRDLQEVPVLSNSTDWVYVPYALSGAIELLLP
jgi:hypothetical protein